MPGQHNAVPPPVGAVSLGARGASERVVRVFWNRGFGCVITCVRMCECICVRVGKKLGAVVTLETSKKAGPMHFFQEAECGRTDRRS